MKALTSTLALFLMITFSTASVGNETAKVYINENLGFNIPGFKYSQSELPCEIGSTLVKYLLSDSRKAGINVEATGVAEKIRNGAIPVLAMDIEELILNEEYKFGTTTKHSLPKVQVTAAIIKGNQMETAKHTCAIATLNEFTPTSNVLDLGTTTTVCGATRKCLKGLSKDIVEWMAPQMK